jgi:hypothetical protein
MVVAEGTPMTDYSKAVQTIQALRRSALTDTSDKSAEIEQVLRETLPKPTVCLHGINLNSHCETCFKVSLGTNQREMPPNPALPESPLRERLEELIKEYRARGESVIGLGDVMDLLEAEAPAEPVAPPDQIPSGREHPPSEQKTDTSASSGAERRPPSLRNEPLGVALEQSAPPPESVVLEQDAPREWMKQVVWKLFELGVIPENSPFSVNKVASIIADHAPKGEQDAPQPPQCPACKSTNQRTLLPPCLYEGQPTHPWHKGNRERILDKLAAKSAHADELEAPPRLDDQQEGETLAVWIKRCGMESVERNLRRERQRYGVSEPDEASPQQPTPDTITLPIQSFNKELQDRWEAGARAMQEAADNRFRDLEVPLVSNRFNEGWNEALRIARGDIRATKLAYPAESPAPQPESEFVLNVSCGPTSSSCPPITHSSPEPKEGKIIPMESPAPKEGK